MEEKEINPTESIAIIEEMLLKTKRNYSDDSFYFILWGWLTFIASLSQFVLIPIVNESSSMVWLLMPLGAVITIFYSMKQEKKVKVKTYLDEHIACLWKALGLGMIVLVTGIIVSQSSLLLPLFILLYAIGTYTSGGILQFKPLIIGGGISFVLSVGGFFVNDRYQLLLIAASVLISYLIPGYMLKAKYQSNERP